MIIISTGTKKKRKKKGERGPKRKRKQKKPKANAKKTRGGILKRLILDMLYARNLLIYLEGMHGRMLYF